MSKAKELVKGFFVGFYRFLRDIVRGFAHERKQYHEEQRVKDADRQRIEEHYRRIDREAYIAEKARQRAITESRTQERARREEDRYWRNVPRNFERELTDVPKFNENFLTEDLYPKKRKKKRFTF